MLPAAAHAASDVLDQPITLDTGHIDAFTPILNDDGSLRLTVKEDVTPPGDVLRTPESVELFVKSDALLEFPEGFVPGLTGNAYHLPLTQNHNLIWPGWETQLIGSEYPAADTDIVISEIDGPGKVFLWSQGGFGTLKSLLKDGGYELPATISQPYPAHTHAAWAFTEPGTYKFTVRADVTATGGKTASTQSAVYTFVVAERSELSPEAPTQTGNTVTIPEQKWVTYTDAAGAPLAAGSIELTENLSVVAHSAFGFDLADGAASEWSFAYEAPVQQGLEITGLKQHYHQGGTIVLNAVATPAIEGASYEWFVQRKDQPAAVPVAGANGASLSLTAEQAFDGARVTARVKDAAGEAVEAAAVTIVVDDHGAAPFNEVTIEGVADHYHTGTVANLSASVAPASVLTRFEWQVQHAGETGWHTVADEHGVAYSFTVTEELEGAKVRAVLTYDDGAEYVASEPVEIEIDDHHGDIETELSIEGLAASYQAGDTAQLRAVQQPQTDEDHYHWFIKRQGSEDYVVIPDALSAELRYAVLAEDAGAKIVAKLYDHDHGVIAESDPVTLTVTKLPETGGDEKPGTAPAAKTGASIDGIDAGGIVLDKSKATQGGTVTVQVGDGTQYAGQWVAAWMFSNPVLLGSDWQQVAANGTITVRIPADANPTAHRIAVFDRAGALIGWQTLTVAQADADDQAQQGGKKLPDTGAGSPVPLVAGGVLLLLAGASAVVIARRRMGSAE